MFYPKPAVGSPQTKVLGVDAQERCSCTGQARAADTIDLFGGLRMEVDRQHPRRRARGFASLWLMAYGPTQTTLEPGTPGVVGAAGGEVEAIGK
jgi:hypothetical protein